MKKQILSQLEKAWFVLNRGEVWNGSARELIWNGVIKNHAKSHQIVFLWEGSSYLSKQREIARMKIVGHAWQLKISCSILPEWNDSIGKPLWHLQPLVFLVTVKLYNMEGNL